MPYQFEFQSFIYKLYAYCMHVSEIDVIFSQNVVFNDNVFQDGNTSQFIKGGVTSLSLQTATQGKLEIKNTKSPITIVVDNDPAKFDKRNVSLRMPGFIQFEEMDVDPASCNMMIRFNKEDNLANLTAIVQYGRPPTHDDYDVKIVLPHDYNEQLNSKMDIKMQNYKIIDTSTLILWNFTNNRYGDSNETKVFIAFSFTGPVPEMQEFSNIFTDDILELKQYYNYTLSAFCAACSYWDEDQNKWSKEGCIVSISTVYLCFYLFARFCKDLWTTTPKNFCHPIQFRIKCILVKSFNCWLTVLLGVVVLMRCFRFLFSVSFIFPHIELKISNLMQGYKIRY